MGSYIYRVTAKVVKLSDGREAHVAKYAYKPYYNWGSDKINAELHFKTGCVASERLTLKNGLVVLLDEATGTKGTLYANPGNLRVFVDDYTFGTERMPKLAEVGGDLTIIQRSRKRA